MDDLRSKIEKVPRGIRGEKSSKDMASSRNLVSTIGALIGGIILIGITGSIQDGNWHSVFKTLWA